MKYKALSPPVDITGDFYLVSPKSQIRMKLITKMLLGCQNLTLYCP